MVFSLADIISGDKKKGKVAGPAVELFKKTEKKDFQHDYNAIPSRKRAHADEMEVDEENMSRRQRAIFYRQERLKGDAAAKKFAEKLYAVTEDGEKVEIQPITGKKAPGVKRVDNNYPRDDKDPEKESRTIFVGNLPLDMVKKKHNLKTMFRQFGKIETLRFRNAPRPDYKVSKRVAVVAKKFHADRKNINAYIRFSTVEEAEKATKLNGTRVEEHIIKVDMALRKEVEKNRSIFLGNLPPNVHENDLYEAFQECGDIEGVRLIRCNQTGMGKGFGYVNFAFRESVDTALAMKDKVTILNRIARIERCVKKMKKEEVETQKKGKKKAPKEELSEKHILDKYYTAGNKGADNQEKKKKKPRHNRRDENKQYREKPAPSKHDRLVQERKEKMAKFVKSKKKAEREAKPFQGETTLEKEIKAPKKVPRLKKNSVEYRKKMIAEVLLKS